MSFFSSKLVRFALPPLTAFALIALALNSFRAMSLQARNAGAQVGDILAFPVDSKGGLTGVRLDVERAGDGVCVLDIGRLRQSGGSLIIEQRRIDDRIYRAHWSGGHTADGTDDCGGSADLLLRQPHITALSLAAGGYGARPTNGTN